MCWRLSKAAAKTSPGVPVVSAITCDNIEQAKITKLFITNNNIRMLKLVQKLQPKKAGFTDGLPTVYG